jgi:hypothetical protein
MRFSWSSEDNPGSLDLDLPAAPPAAEPPAPLITHRRRRAAGMGWAGSSLRAPTKEGTTTPPTTQDRVRNTTPKNWTHIHSLPEMRGSARTPAA